MPVNNDLFPGGSSIKDIILNSPPPSLPRVSFTPGSTWLLHCRKGLPAISGDINKQSLDPLIPITMLAPFDMLYCGLSSKLPGDNKCSTYYTLDSFKKFYTSCILELLNGWKGKIIWKCIARPFSWWKDAISISDFFSLPTPPPKDPFGKKYISKISIIGGRYKSCWPKREPREAGTTLWACELV